MQLIDKFIENAKKLGVCVDSVVVEENGIAQERVVNKFGLHQLRSCGKILIAMAYGIAINDKLKVSGGYLSLDTKVYETFKRIENDTPDEVKEWTIRTLLTHSTGYQKMMMNASQVKDMDKFKLLPYIFETPTKYSANAHFTYNNVEPYLLSVFFNENFNVDISDVINERIFMPLNIKNFTWTKYGNYCAAATGLFLNYKDFHKIGKLLLDFGRYEGQEVVPESWIKEMTQPQIECPDYYKPERVLPKCAAGYFTWISRDGIVFRDGSEGQYIICDYKNNRLITIMSTQKEMNVVTECLRGLI